MISLWNSLARSTDNETESPPVAHTVVKVRFWRRCAARRNNGLNHAAWPDEHMNATIELSVNAEIGQMLLTR